MNKGQRFSPQERDALIEQARQVHSEHKQPSVVQLAGNFTKAVVKHLGDGMKKVDVQKYQRRLNQCNGCSLRVKKRCTHEDCGCFIDKKAWWNSEECPLGKWNGV